MYADIKEKGGHKMADTPNKAAGAAKKVLNYIKDNKKPLAIGGGSGLGLGVVTTLLVGQIKSKKGKK
jgi:hypothetical protein